MMHAGKAVRRWTTFGVAILIAACGGGGGGSSGGVTAGIDRGGIVTWVPSRLRQRASMACYVTTGATIGSTQSAPNPCVSARSCASRRLDRTASARQRASS
jgi:hypothetical protein